MENNEIIDTAFEELIVISSDEGNRRLYEARLKQQRDIWSFEDAARMEGEESGIFKEKERIARAMLAKGMSKNDVTEVTGLTIDDVLRLQTE
jgi:predicted transposase/invertase (TIGR01784 family)